MRGEREQGGKCSLFLPDGKYRRVSHTQSRSAAKGKFISCIISWNFGHPGGVSKETSCVWSGNVRRTPNGTLGINKICKCKTCGMQTVAAIPSLPPPPQAENRKSENHNCKFIKLSCIQPHKKKNIISTSNTPRKTILSTFNPFFNPLKFYFHKKIYPIFFSNK